MTQPNQPDSVEETVKQLEETIFMRGAKLFPETKNAVINILNTLITQAKAEAAIDTLKRTQRLLKEEDPAVLAGWIELSLFALQDNQPLP